MPEQDIPIGRDIVDVVSQRDGRSWSIRIQLEQSIGQKTTVETVGETKGREADRGGEEWGDVHAGSRWPPMSRSASEAVDVVCPERNDNAGEGGEEVVDLGANTSALESDGRQ